MAESPARDETPDPPPPDRRPATPDDRDAMAGVDVDALERIVNAQDDPSDEEAGDDETRPAPPR
jgi:hypothetical protein